MKVQTKGKLKKEDEIWLNAADSWQGCGVELPRYPLPLWVELATTCNGDCERYLNINFDTEHIFPHFRLFKYTL